MGVGGAYKRNLHCKKISRFRLVRLEASKAEDTSLYVKVIGCSIYSLYLALPLNQYVSPLQLSFLKARGIRRT